MFNKIRKAGEDFTLNSLTSYVADYLAKPGATAEDNKQFGGVAGLALGNLLRAVGIIGAGLTVVTLLASPVGLATVGTLAFGAAFGAAGVFGQGMVDGGDKATNFVTGAREMRGEIFGDALGDLKSWSNKKLGTKFGLAASRDAQVEQLQPAAQPVVVKQPEQKL
jgi:hypothetical protein